MTLARGGRNGAGSRPTTRHGQRLEDATAVPDRAFDDPLSTRNRRIGGLPLERHPRPVFRPAKVVLEVQADVAGGFLEQRRDDARHCDAIGKWASRPVQAWVSLGLQ